MPHVTRILAAAAAAATLAAAPASAQEWALGLDGGLNRSDVAGEGVDDAATETESGVRVGALVRYTFSPGSIFAVQTGAAYARKGTLLEGSDLDLDYLEIPLVLLVNVPLGEAPVQPRLFGGGSFGFELDCEVGPPGGDGEAVNCADAAIGETAPVDIGVRFGGGLDIRLNRHAAMVLDAGYELGLTDFTESEPEELKNRNLFFSGGFMFLP